MTGRDGGFSRHVLDGHAAFVAGASPDALAVSRALMLYLWDLSGDELLDFDSLANPLGHLHHLVVAAVGDHLNYHLQTGTPGAHAQRWVVQLASDLSSSLSPGDEPSRVLFCESGRVASWLASGLFRRPGLVPAATATGWHDNLPGAEVLSRPDDLDRLRHSSLLTCLADAAARPVDPDWFAAADAAGVPLVVDETPTGHGRWGSGLWGQHALGLKPAATVVGGPLGGGLPLGAVVAAPGLLAGDPDPAPDPLSGCPLACSAGAAVLIGLGLMGRDARHGEAADELGRALDELVSQFGHVTGHHGRGMWRGLSFSSPGLAAAFPSQARRLGLNLPRAVGSVVPLAPPLVCSPSEAVRGVDLMADVLMSWDDQGVR